MFPILETGVLGGGHDQRGQVPGDQDRKQHVHSHEQAFPPAGPAINAQRHCRQFHDEQTAQRVR